MLNTIIACYLGVKIYYTFQTIKKSISEKTLENDIEKQWLKLKDDCYYIKMNLLRKKYKNNN